MSLFHRATTATISPERAIWLWTDAANRHHGLDPLYRHRLRGKVLNHYVAAREGAATASRRSGHMGAIGRASLYASFAVALSLGSAMAVSGASVPGDLLYPMKRELEELRAQVLPAHFRDELAAYAFAQRVHELGRLLDEGDTARAAALVADVRSSYAEWRALRPAGGADDGIVTTQLSILSALLDRLPAPAQEAIQRAVETPLGSMRNTGGGTPAAGPGADVATAGEPLGGAAEPTQPSDPGAGGISGSADDPQDPQGERRDSRGKPATTPGMGAAASPEPSPPIEPESDSD